MRLIALINSMGVIDQTWGGGPVLLWMYVVVAPFFHSHTEKQQLGSNCVSHSFAESNLSVICGSLTTVKIFVKHISPRLLGTTDPASKAGPGFSTSAAPSSMRGGGLGTNTSKIRHDKYERFDDGPMYPLQTVANVEVSRDGGSDDNLHHQHHSSNKADKTWYDGRRNSGNSNGESGSEKAIVQTRTTTVSYST